VAIELWPSWVDRLPRLTFRIEIKQAVQGPAGSPGQSPAASVK
jgi:hypothetical protein